mmetsp:Transcript_3211/g.10737  ORF Transcript_3211/g.10737 Transcript_3211/m.10737 type:complete len:254 (+) Transcript_3211:1153-1914(+)
MPGVVFAVRGGGGAESGARGDDGGAHGGGFHAPRGRGRVRVRLRGVLRGASCRGGDATRGDADGETRDGGGAPGRDGRAGVRPPRDVPAAPSRSPVDRVRRHLLRAHGPGAVLRARRGGGGAAPGRGRGQDVAQEFGVLPTGAAGVVTARADDASGRADQREDREDVREALGDVPRAVLPRAHGDGRVTRRAERSGAAAGGGREELTISDDARESERRTTTERVSRAHDVLDRVTRIARATSDDDGTRISCSR